jgi:RimJ/RimL family protein N-acetyltransferase
LTASRVIGYVIATNTPSVRIFARLGFRQEDGSDQFPGSIRFYKTL